MLERKCLIWLAAAVLATLAGCAGSKAPDSHAVPAKAAGDTSRTSLDWPGRYRGVVPCADCEGIETTVTLSEDGHFVLETRYLGREDSARTTTGTFSWSAAGNIVTLSGIEDGPSQYQVGENMLLPLDREGRPITGASASNYRLAKVPAAGSGEVLLMGTRWKLIELGGRAIPASPGPKGGPYLILSPNGHRVTGFGGCNTFNGGFELPAPTRITFSRMARTLMACPSGMDTEEAFLAVLAKVDSYAIEGNRLSLHRARMAPLARFEAE